jgi:hypothetical protein
MIKGANGVGWVVEWGKSDIGEEGYHERKS